MKLYYHKTSGGAEYLFDTYIKYENGHKEGVINDKTKFSVRIDGDITKDAELNGRWIQEHATLKKHIREQNFNFNTQADRDRERIDKLVKALNKAILVSIAINGDKTKPVIDILKQALNI